MKTLQLILQGYCNGEYSLKEMMAIVNQTMEFKCYQMKNGKRYLQAIFKGELIEVSI